MHLEREGRGGGGGGVGGGRAEKARERRERGGEGVSERMRVGSRRGCGMWGRLPSVLA